MPDSNGKQKWSDVAHRIGIWGAVVVIAAKLFTMGTWVGAAQEKFEDAETVEETQKALLLKVNTVATRQEAIVTAIQGNTKAIETSKKEVLDAIAALKE